MHTHRELANAIRALSMDSVQRAGSGHPGAPMGMADIAEVLWRDYLKHNPKEPGWADRDRFVLSNGHGSMLLYSLLYLTGYDVTIDDLKSFRQMHSRTPGHPEYGYTPGVETTTGPLGQGIANAVGFALAERIMGAQFNRPGFNIVDHRTYVFLGDGCLMEGVSHEACSLAGTLGLSKLVAFYDDNGISIDGEVEGWFTDDTPGRFEAYGWHVVRQVDGHDSVQIRTAIEEAYLSSKPTLICCKTIIGFGAPNKQGKEECHGSALGEAEVAATREALGWTHPPFEIPLEIRALWDGEEKGGKSQDSWGQLFASYADAYPKLAAEFKRRMAGELPSNFERLSSQFILDTAAKGETIASRKASQNTLDALAPLLPEILGGSADLAGSNLTRWRGCKSVTIEDPTGNYLHYGVREFGMSAIMNGIALHGGFTPFGGTFLMFMEYGRNAVRMAALMRKRVVYVYTHDSIGLGEDGPTHQPVEQIASLRYTPNLDTWRPCDAVETAVAWKLAITRQDGPTALILSRQNLQHYDRDEPEALISRGGYVLRECAGAPELILIATGSEVQLAVKVYERLTEEGHNVRVVSLPCTSVFDRQPREYQERVLPANVECRIAIEAAIADFWWKYVGPRGRVVGMKTFGESAPADQLMEHFGFTADNVLLIAKGLLEA